MKQFTISFILTLLSVTAQAAVILGIPKPITVAPGGSFDLTVVIRSSYEPLTGASYNLTPSAPIFSLDARSLAGSPFKMSYANDAFGLVTGRTAELGGDVADINKPLGIGSYSLGILTFSVVNTAVPGTYSMISSGDGYYEDAGDLVYRYNAVGGVLIDVVRPTGSVPDPSLAMLLPVVLLLRGERRT